MHSALGVYLYLFMTGLIGRRQLLMTIEVDKGHRRVPAALQL